MIMIVRILSSNISYRYIVQRSPSLQSIVHRVYTVDHNIVMDSESHDNL